MSRPRPRPRPRAPAPIATPEPSTSTAEIPSVSIQISSTDDEDSHFMRNRSKTGWKKIEQLEKERKKQAAARMEEDSAAETDESEDGSVSPRSRKNKKHQKPVPNWTRQKVINLLSSDDDEDDALHSIENTPNRKRSDHKRQKRQRSRSRSITPPPPLSINQIENAKNLVRQTLDIAPRAASPTAYDEDDSTDTITLDPELMMIAQAVQNQAQSFTRDVSVDPDLVGGPEVVKIRVKWQPHPLDDAGRIRMWDFKMRRHDTFKELFEETADEAGVLIDSLIISHDGRRLFSPSTPHTVGIWAEAELVACDKTTAEYIRANRYGSSSAIIPQDDDNGQGPARTRSPSAGFGWNGDSDSGAESESQEPSGEKFKLILRSAVTKDITLTVRPTTTCGAIVKAFLKSAGLSEQYQGKSPKKGKQGKKLPQLMVDGGKMDPASEIGDADLEDGDLVEVVGL